MKKVISLDEMSLLSGGSKFWDGFCVAVGVANIASPLLAFSVVGYFIVKAAGVGCIIYSATEL